jgi:hypothetical protein
MDVYPISGDLPASYQAAIGVRYVDGQAYAGTVIAHALLVQALAMNARRLARSGRRQGNTPIRLVEAQRTQAILHGLDARVPIEQRADKPGRVRVSALPKEDLGQVVAEFMEQLMPEFGTLSVSVYELAPVIGALLPFASVPRNESDYHATLMNANHVRSARELALRIGSLDAHRPENFLLGQPPEWVSQLARDWTTWTSSPPPRAGRSNSQEAAGRQNTPERPRPDQGTTSRPRQSSDHGNSELARVKRIAEHADWPLDQLAAAITREASLLTSVTEQLVPWLGPRHSDMVKTARKKLRPPGDQWVRTSLSSLEKWDHLERQLEKKARTTGLALLSISAADAEASGLQAQLENLVKHPPDGLRTVILGISVFPGRDKKMQHQAELIYFQERGA